MKPEGIINEILTDINFEGAEYPYEFDSVIIRDARGFHKFLYQVLPGIIREYQEKQRAQAQASQLELRYGAEIFQSVYKNEEEAAETLKKWTEEGFLTPRIDKPSSEAVKDKARALYRQLNIPFVVSVTPVNSSAGYLDDILCIESLFVGMVYAQGQTDAFSVNELRSLHDDGGVVLYVTEENLDLLPNALLYLMEAYSQYEADFDALCYKVPK